MDAGGSFRSERWRCLRNAWRGARPLIVYGFTSEGFSIASNNFAELSMRLSPSPAFNVVGDFSIGAWGFIRKTMNLVVSQHVDVARWACVTKDHVAFFFKSGKSMERRPIVLCPTNKSKDYQEE